MTNIPPIIILNMKITISSGLKQTSTYCLLLSFALFSVTSCCAIINGRTQDVNVAASPAGAKLYVDGVDKGTVPQQVAISRTGSHTIRIEAPGYAPYETSLSSGCSGWVFGNIFIGGLIGLAIDFGTGAIWVYDNVNATLTPEVKVSTVHGAPPIGARKVGQMARL